uniref:AAA family ATPase n=2 Tax=Flavobacterium sp. TaxID=239 RepID=UPI00404927AB
MNKNIIFVGGIHGVGKSKICQEICTELNLEYLSASNVLKWQEINDQSNCKVVKNINNNQKRLLDGLKNILTNEKDYVLEGHYCLLNSENKIENISSNTFQKIKPKALFIILGELKEIKRRLIERDDKDYEIEFLDRFQNKELARAKNLSETLNIPLYICKNVNYLSILNLMSEINRNN